MSWQTGDEGSGSLVSFIVAMSLFALVFAGATVFIANTLERNDDSAQHLSPLASDTLRSALSTPGIPTDWSSAPPDRFGLLQEGRTSTLDLAKIRALRTWGASADTKYDEIQTALALGTHDFHLRTHPVFEKTTGANIRGLEHVRIAYVGNWTTSGGEGAASVKEAASLDNLEVSFTNAYVDSNGVADGDKFPDKFHDLTRQLPARLAGALGVVDQGTTSSWAYWRPVRVSNLTSAFSDVSSDNVFTTSYNTKTRMTYVPGEDDRLVLSKLDLRHHEDGDAATLLLNHRVIGDRVEPTPFDPAVHSHGRVEVLCLEFCGNSPDWEHVGPHFDDEGSVDGTGKHVFDDAIIDLSAYNGQVVAVSLLWQARAAPSGDAGWFVAYAALESTRDGVTALTYENNLDYRSSRYHTLVIGSEADQEHLESVHKDQSLKNATHDWVNAGGNLIALGGAKIHHGWLQPTFTSGTPLTYSGTLLEGQSDFTHPLLNTPHSVAHRYYVPSAKTYRIGADFTGIIMYQEDPSAPLPHRKDAAILGVSGSNLKGSVILTAWRPHLFDEAERERFLVNSIAYGVFRELYLSYGPAIPPYSPIGSATRAVLVDASDAGLGTMQLTVTMYVWP